MKIGTRLTAVLMLCLVPVLAVYMYLSIKTSSNIFVEGLSREARASTRSLGTALTPDIAADDWEPVREALERMRHKRVEVAVFYPGGELRFALPQFPITPPPPPDKLREAVAERESEFTYSGGGGYWVCHAVVLEGKDGRPIGILLAARERSSVGQELSRRVLFSALAAVAVMILIATTIPLATARYVSRPLAELSRRVTGFSAPDNSPLGAAHDEVQLISEEFRRLDQDLRTARQNLLAERERELELERRLRHTDKLATIGTIASGLAHEIGTPLNVIRGRAEHLLGNKQNPPKTAEGLEIIVSQIDRISRIVRTMLDQSSRRESTRRSACDLRPIVQRTLTLLETEAGRRRVNFVCELGNSPLIVECDPDHLQQVFVNLEMNALDAMAETGGTLRITAACNWESNAGKVRLFFDDSGPGIPESYRDRIFDSFFTTKDPGKGTGMGLAVSQAIIRDCDGEIAVEPRESGARFVVTLPMRPRIRRASAPSADRTA
ncbi:MAG: HAMP domain-containing sensor histidine kinase [Candidatus Binataceae bacterium]